MAGLASYRLSEEQSQKIFTEQILPAEFPGSILDSNSNSSNAKPLAVLAVGQTGAGKTLLAPAILQELPTPPVHLIADTYKTYHPEYSHLIQTNPAQASPATGYDARKWLSMAAREAVRRRANVLLESACRHPDDFCELARIFRDGGYRVEVVVMAVPEGLSRLGLLTRFHGKRPEGQSRGLPVRLTPVKVHDDAYAGLLHAAKFLDDEKCADQVVVLRRGNLVVSNAGSVEASVLRERSRPLTLDEKKVALADMQNLVDACVNVHDVRRLLQSLMSDEAQSLDKEYGVLVPLEFGDKQGHHVLRLGR